MYPTYKDIREKLGNPLWHDEHGVPRYAEFHPKYLGIYDHFAVLFLVQCQSCRKTFPCAIGKKDFTLSGNTPRMLTLTDVLSEYVGWGDAPWHDEDTQCAGTTMSTDVVKLLSVWERKDCEWQQVKITQEMTDLVVEF